MIAKTIAITLCLTAMVTRGLSQELGIELNGGLQGTLYQLQNGSVSQLPGGSLGLSYSFRLGSKWDLITGISGGVYRTRAKLKDSAFTYGEVDDAGSAFQYNVRATGYEETQQFFAASIPLLLQYHTAGIGTRWYLDAGGRALFPLTASIQQSAQQLSLSGYYPDYNIEVTNLPQHGFGTINGWKGSQTVMLKPTAVLSLSTGLSFPLSRGSRLYTGLYFDYGLTALKTGNDSMPLATYSSAGISQVQTNSVLKMPIAGQVTVLSFGLQIRISFGSSRAGPSAAAKRAIKREAQPAQPPAGDTISYTDAQTIETPIVFGILGETSLSDLQEDHLNDVAAVMMRYPGIRISIEGHICNSGTETEDVKVGEARARVVARYLRSRGIDRNRMDVSNLRESDPVLPNNPAANYRNRRVVITME